ncbi:MAG: cbb3-type cytochrome c oxidase subunit 3 [Magnetococcales bacterium]|nr:cbb3-type cytochrome c oxidase subunit 3 [Magnetococcales bacterium]
MNVTEMFAFAKVFSLVWFFLLFVGVVIWVYWPGRKGRLEEAGRRALDDDADAVGKERAPPPPASEGTPGH